MTNDDERRDGGDADAAKTTHALLVELARRFRLRFGRLEVVFHDGRPSPRLTIEHRIQSAVDDGEHEAQRPPVPRRGRP